MNNTDTLHYPNPNIHISKHGRVVSFSAVAFILLTVFIVSYYVRHLCRRYQNNQSNPRATASVVAADASSKGLDYEMLAALPVFTYSENPSKQEKTECSICLAEFKGGEKVRELPKCLHRFHMECVDVWFRCHSSCPLCRVGLEPGNVNESFV